MTTLTTAPPPTFTITGLDTIDGALAALERVVAKHGPNVCRSMSSSGNIYITGGDNDQPSCLVGHVLVAAGVPAGWFAGQCQIFTEADADLGEATDRNRRGIHVIGDELGLPVPVACVLAEAQMAQDTGGTWGYALICARSEARRLKRQVRMKQLHAERKARRTRRFAFLR